MREHGIEHTLPPNEVPNPLWAKRPVRLINRMPREDKLDVAGLELMSPNGVRRARHHHNACRHLSSPAEIEMDEEGNAHVPDDLLSDGTLRNAPYVYHGLEQLGHIVNGTPRARPPTPTTTTTMNGSQHHRSVEDTSADVFGSPNGGDIFDGFQPAGGLDGDLMFPPPAEQPEGEQDGGDPWAGFQEVNGADISFEAAANPQAEDLWNRMMVGAPAADNQPTPPPATDSRKRAALRDAEEEPESERTILETTVAGPATLFIRKRAAVRDDEDPEAKKDKMIQADVVLAVQAPPAAVILPTTAAAAPPPVAPRRPIIPTRQRMLNKVGYQQCSFMKNKPFRSTAPSSSSWRRWQRLWRSARATLATPLSLTSSAA